ncbi:MAG TPA: hypothetical protein VJO52_12270 [Gemmatimonadaceae bacterium]|nr:hypothetical protein [Gemmatimonadaceae bacterium]
MQRRFPVFLCIAALSVLAACSNDAPPLPSAPNGPAIPPNADRLFPAGCSVITESQITKLFPRKSRVLATVGYVVVLLDLATGHPKAATNDMFKLWDFTLKTYYAGNLLGGQSTATQNATLAFGQALYCLVGLDGSTLTLNTTPLDPNNVVQVVFPSASDQTVVTGSQQGGVMIPGNTLSQPVTISITLLNGPFTFPAGPLNTKLDQYGPFFEFKVVPQQTFATPVVAAACIATPAGAPPPPSVDIAHNVGNGIEILPTAPVNFLDCGGSALNPQRSVTDLMRDRQYGKAANRVVSLAAEFFSPTSLHAAGSGIGGKTKSFSPFGGVDTAVVVQLPASFPAQPQHAPAGSDVASPPSVLVQTTNGHTPLGGASVTFAITAGGGSLGPASSTTALASSTVTTATATGLATVPNWTLGVGPDNAVTANASITLPATISGFPTTGAGVSVSGSPVSFTATSTDLIPYQSPGYVYMSGAAGVAPGFEQPGFAATSQDGWQTGTAAFASSNLGASCPSLVPTVGTPWVNSPAPSDMLLRRSFTLPGWWTAGLTVGIAIDNDFQLFIDGTNVTPTNSPAFNPSTGFVTHENCATRDSFLVPISVAGGTHLMAIRARDRGTAAYVDARLSVTP